MPFFLEDLTNDGHCQTFHLTDKRQYIPTMTSFEKDFVPKFPSYHLNAQNELETYLAKHPQRIRTTTILACSSRIVDGPLCQYRRGFFDHLKPRAFVTNVGTVGWIFFVT